MLLTFNVRKLEITKFLFFSCTPKQIRPVSKQQNGENIWSIPIETPEPISIVKLTVVDIPANKEGVELVVDLKECVKGQLCMSLDILSILYI